MSRPPRIPDPWQEIGVGAGFQAEHPPEPFLPLDRGLTLVCRGCGRALVGVLDPGDHSPRYRHLASLRRDLRWWGRGES